MWELDVQESELDPATDQVVFLRLQELIQQSSHDPPKLLLQSRHLTVAERQSDEATPTPP